MIETEELHSEAVILIAHRLGNAELRGTGGIADADHMIIAEGVHGLGH